MKLADNCSTFAYPLIYIIGITFANFMVPGTCPLSIDVLIIMDRGSAISFLRYFTSLDDIPS